MRPHEAVLLARVRADAKSGETRRIRLEAGLSLAELGGACDGVAASTVSRWERGLQAPRGPAGLKYARVLERLSAGRDSHAAAS